MRNAFIVRMSNPGFAEYALRESKIVIGWAKLTGLRNSKDSDPDKPREKIRKTLRDSGWYNSERAIGNVAGSIDRFIYSIRESDYIIFPVDKGFYLGVVSAKGRDQAFCNEAQEEEDRAWQWDVVSNKDENGNPKKFSREILTAKLHYSLKTKHTCIQLDKGIESDLEQSIPRKVGIDLNQRILDEKNSYIETIKAELQNTLNENTFEDFIVKVLLKEGAIKVNILLKKDYGANSLIAARNAKYKCQNAECGFSDVRSLELDHVNGKKSKYTAIFACLCANCHNIKSFTHDW